MNKTRFGYANTIVAGSDAQQVLRLLQRAPASELRADTAGGARFSHSFSQLRVNQPGDVYEREADRLAAAVIKGGASVGFGVHGRPGGLLQRDETKEAKKPPSNEEKYKEAAKKVGEAFLKTDLGMKIKSQATELGEAFIGTLPGKIITGAAAVGAVSYIAATNAELPMQVPEIPLDILTPGLSMNLTYEGPVQKPTKAMISFTYKFGAGEKKEKKPAMSEKEKYQAETARMAAEQQKFREGLKSPEQRAAEDKAFWDAFWRMKGKDPMNPLNLPGLKKKEEEKSLLMMRKEAAPGGPHIDSPTGVPPLVGEVLRSSGQPIDPLTRAWMERSFGADFGGVRLHTGPQASESARQVNALAYTVGRDVVFAAGQFNPGSSAGRRLLAHELAHVVQQGAALPRQRAGSDAVQVLRPSPERRKRQEDPSALPGDHE